MSKRPVSIRHQSKQTYRDNVYPLTRTSSSSTSSMHADQDITINNLIDLLHAGSLGCWKWDISKNKIIVEPGIAEALGYETNNEDVVISYSEMADKLHPEEKSTIIKNIRDYLAGKLPRYSAESRVRTQSGTYKWLFNTAIIVQRNQKNEPRIVAGVIYDITRRKLGEQTNRLLAKLPFTNPDSVMIMNLDLNIIYINPAGQQQFGEKMHAMFPPELKERLYTAYNNKRVETIQYVMDDHTYLLKIKPLSGEKQCMVIISDISNVVQIVNERNLYFNALQWIKQALFITDKEGYIVHVNHEFEQLYGYTEEEMIGKNPNVLNAGKETYSNFGFSEKEYRTLFREMWTALKDESVGKWEGKVINRSKTGKLMWVRSVTNAVFNEKHQITHFVSMPIDITTNLSKENNMKRDLYNSIAELAELRDNETGAHMRRVGIYSKLIAKGLGLPDKFCDDMEVFAPMHDIGKVGIPDNILLAKRKLTDDEYEAMKRHTLFGYNIVRKNKDMSLVSQITLSHHERYDGKGYPYGLAGEDIPVAARIVALADVYDALRSKRPYKEPWTHEEAMEHIVDSSGGHFDPKIVNVFVKLNEKFRRIFDEIKDEDD